MAQSIISFTIQDDDGDKKSLAMYWPNSDITSDDIDAVILDLAGALDAVIDGKIVAVNVTRAHDVPAGLKADPVAHCEVQKGALLHFRRDGQTRIYSMFVPTWTPAKFTGDEVNDAAAGVSTLTSFVTTTNTQASGNVAISDEFGNDLSSYVNGEKVFRK
jgi:hypothetical protein